MKPRRVFAPTVAERRSLAGTEDGVEVLRLAECGSVRLCLVGVLEEVPDSAQVSRAQPFVHGDRIRERKDAGHKRLDRQCPASDEVHEAFQVPALGPANVARWIVHSGKLVNVVVATRAVGPREPDVQLLVVVGVPRQVQLELADVDDACPVARQSSRRLDGPVGGATGHQEHVVGTPAARQLGQGPLDAVDAFIVGRVARHGTVLLGQRAPLPHDVETHHPHPGGHQELGDELAHQAEPDHAGCVPQLGLGPAHPVHGDGTDGGEGSQRGGQTVGHRHAKVDGNPVDLGVQGVLVAGARHELSQAELLRPPDPPRRRHHTRSIRVVCRSRAGSWPWCRRSAVPAG